MIPTFLQTAWPMIRRALPYIAIALALAAGLRFVYNRGADSRNAEVALVKQSLTTARANTAAAQAAITAQNAAAQAIAERAKTAEKATSSALAAVAAADRRAAGERARADALARKVPVGVCVDMGGNKLSEDVWQKL